MEDCFITNAATKRNRRKALVGILLYMVGEFMNENSEHDATKLEAEAKEEEEHRRTKRVISKPRYLEDYATK